MYTSHRKRNLLYIFSPHYLFLLQNEISTQFISGNSNFRGIINRIKTINYLIETGERSESQ